MRFPKFLNHMLDHHPFKGPVLLPLGSPAPHSSPGLQRGRGGLSFGVWVCLAWQWAPQPLCFFAPVTEKELLRSEHKLSMCLENAGFPVKLEKIP